MDYPTISTTGVKAAGSFFFQQRYISVRKTTFQLAGYTDPNDAATQNQKNQSNSRISVSIATIRKVPLRLSSEAKCKMGDVTHFESFERGSRRAAPTAFVAAVLF